MPMMNNLPKGCCAMRGSSDIARTPARGGGRAHQTNKLYMLNVRRESLTNKKHTLETQLKAIRGQLRGLDADIQETERNYKKLKGKNRRSPVTDGNGHAVKRMRLKY